MAGDIAKYIDLPLANYSTLPFDKVLKDGKIVGVSTYTGYTYNERAMISLGVVDVAHSEPGAEVTLVWGEEGRGSTKPTVERHEQAEIRATVASVPVRRSGARGLPAALSISNRRTTMAYIFHEDDLPKLVAVVPGRERTFFVNKELTNIDDMLAGVMRVQSARLLALSLPRDLRALLLHHGRQRNGGNARRASATGGAGRLGLYSRRSQTSPARHGDAACSISNSRRPIVSRPTSWTARRTICAGTAWTAAFGCKHKKEQAMTTSLTFIDTNKLPRVKTPQGEVTEILNQQLVGAKNVLGTLRWLSPGEKFQPEPSRETSAHLLDGRPGEHPPGQQGLRCFPRRGRLSGPSESATIQAGAGSSLKLFHLMVPRIPA